MDIRKLPTGLNKTMSDSRSLVELRDDTGALAWIRPDLGGWLLRYARPVAGAGRIEALHYDPAVVDRYPREMWAGNPVLFPHVSLNLAKGEEGQYELDGTIYRSPQHGFARRVPWRVAAVSESSLTMGFCESAATLPSYPFQFRHEIRYSLVGGRLELVQTVENTGSKLLPFSTGIHPYFRLPLGPASERSRCHVRLPRCTRYNAIGRYESFFTEPVAAQEWPVTRDVSGTLLLGEFSERELALVDPVAGVEVVVNFEEAPEYRFAAIWSPSSDAPFYCLEPWTALPNSFGRSDGEYLMLPPGKTFHARLWLDVRPKK